MNNDFNKHKNFLKKQLLNNYNYQILILTNNLNSNIRIINNNKNFSRPKKNLLINNLINIYKNNIIKIKKNYDIELNNINNRVIPTLYNSLTNTISKKALCIGINYYGTNYQLNGCINDANNIKEFLNNYGFNNITILTDDLNNNIPNKTNILNSITNLFNNTKSGDILFLFYSGHGSYIRDNNNDDLSGYDQLIIPNDFNPIIDDDLKKIIDNNLKDDVLLIALFDSCFSGSVLDLKYMYNDNTYNNNQDYNENWRQNDTKGNVILISGCSDLQTSSDAIINNKNNGALTWSFLDVLAGYNSSNNISWRNLLLSMREKLKLKGFTQIPQLSSGKFVNVDEKISFL